MLIFVDESGSFVIPPEGRISISCVGAAVVPEATANLLWDDMDRIRRRKTFPKGELKGSLLGESEVALVIEAAARYGVRFFVTATEMSQYDIADIVACRDGQADRLVASLTPQHKPSLVEQLHDLRRRMGELSPQLFVQFSLTLELVSRLLRTITVHFSLCRPRELGAFHWKLDGKDSTRTQSEQLWQLLGAGLLQSVFIRERFSAVREGDYSDFDAEFLDATKEWPEYFSIEKPADGAKGRLIDLKKIMTDSFAFADSRSSRGLQLVDVLTNAYRRVLMGKLQANGWAKLPTIMLRGEHPAVGMLHMTSTDSGVKPAPPEIADVLAEIESRARSMLDV